MLGCEIIEAAEEGEVILWSRVYAQRILLDHGSCLTSFVRDAAPQCAAGPVPAHLILEWLGY